VRFFLGFFFLKKQELLCFSSGQWRISRQSGPWIARNFTIIQDPTLWDWTDFGPAQTTESPGHKPLIVNVVVVGPFREEEEGIGIASDVIKAEGEDPETPGYLRRDKVRTQEGCWRSQIVGVSPLALSWWNPGIITIPQYWFNKTEQHTARGNPGTVTIPQYRVNKTKKHTTTRFLSFRPGP